MSNDACTTVADCQASAAQGRRNCHEEKLHLFPVAGPLESAAMDILGPMTKTESVNQHVIFLTHWCTKWTRAILVITVTLTSAATVFVDTWIIPYRMSTYLLPVNVPHFVWKFFTELLSILVLDTRLRLHTTARPTAKLSSSSERPVRVSNIMLQDIGLIGTSTYRCWWKHTTLESFDLLPRRYLRSSFSSATTPNNATPGYNKPWRHDRAARDNFLSKQMPPSTGLPLNKNRCQV